MLCCITSQKTQNFQNQRKPGDSPAVQIDGNHLSPYCKSDSKFGTSLLCWGYESPSVGSWLRVQEFPSLWDLKKHMTGNRVGTDADMKQAVTSYIKILETDFFHTGIQASVTQLEEFSGDYVKMWWVQSATHASWILQNWKTVFCIVVLVNLIFENSMQTFTLQAALSRNFRSFTDKSAPFFLCSILVFCAMEFNIKVITFKNCAVDHHNYADIQKWWDV